MNEVELIFNVPEDVKALFDRAPKTKDNSALDALIRNFVTSGIDFALVNFKGDRAKMNPHSKYTLVNKRIVEMGLKNKVRATMSGNILALKKVGE